jgi:hypothetical protein
MSAAGFQIMQSAGFDAPHKFSRCKAGKQYRVVERNKFCVSSAPLTKKLKAKTPAHYEKFVTVCY